MRILIILLAVVISGQLVAQHNFRFYDSLTYRLYSQHSWKELTRVGREALRAGNDYYFLRMRLGIAAAEQNKHRLAANHFNKALRFNSGSSLGKSYIVDSHLKSGMEIENDRFESVLTQNRKSNPLRTITFTVGGAIPTAEGRTTAGNVDGDANIYGELTHSGTIGYLHAGATFKPFRFARSHLALSNLWLQRNQYALLGGTDTVSHRRFLQQRQLNMNIAFRLANRLYLAPSVSLMIINDRPMKISYDQNEGSFAIRATDTTFLHHNFSLRIAKEMPFMGIALSAGAGNLSGKYHWQASTQLAFYPFANLNLYTVSSLTAIDSKNTNLRFFFRQRCGIALSERFWLEADHIDGYLKNVFDEFSFMPFNPAGEIERRSALSILFIYNPRLQFRLESAVVRLKDYFMTYTDFNSFVIESYKLNHYHLSGGVTWNL